MRIWKVSSIILALLVFIAACNNPKPANTTTSNNVNSTVNSSTTAQPTAKADELASLKLIYNDKCARCHKEDGTGGKIDIEGTIINSEDLTSEKMKKMEDAKYIKYIENGIPDEGMPAFKGKLTDEQIKSIVNYIRKEFQSK